MAEPLVAQYGPDVPRAIARMVAAVHPSFDADTFLQDALSGYEALALMPRGKHIARALRRHLPQDYAQALPILLASDNAFGTRRLSSKDSLYREHFSFVVVVVVVVAFFSCCCLFPFVCIDLPFKIEVEESVRSYCCCCCR